MLQSCTNFNPGANKHTAVSQKFSHSIFFTPANGDEITAVIKGLKKQDTEQTELVLQLSDQEMLHIHKPLTFLTNLSLSTGRFPGNLKTSTIKPLFRNESAYEMENYRKISLILSFFNLLDKIVCIRLITF